MGKRLLSLGFVLSMAVPVSAQETPPTEEGSEAKPAEEGTEGAPAPEPEPEAAVDPALAARTVHWGVGGRIRYVFMPKAILNLFVDQSQPMSSVGFGVELVRRKGDFDVVFGFEYENIAADEGLWTENGGSPAGGDTDYVTFDGFALLGLDVGFIWHKDLNERFAIRYGAGIGLGFLLGDYIQTDAACSQVTPPAMNCTVPAPGGSRVVNDSKPPVVPIVNALIGGRFKANDQISLNAEFGFRDMFFLGIGADYVF